MNIVRSHPTIRTFTHALVVLGFLSAYIVPFAYAQPIGGDVQYAPDAFAGSHAVATAPPAPPAIQEVHIANNGLMLVRGARVVAISGNTMTITLIWGSMQFTWAVNGDGATRYFGPGGAKESVSDIQAGDVVSVTGMLSASDSNPTIEAEFVRRQ